MNDQNEDTHPFAIATKGEYTPTIRFFGSTAKATALPYAYLLKIDFNPSGLIELSYTNCRVEIKGRCLYHLFNSLSAYMVVSIREFNPVTDLTPEVGTCCIHSLKIVEKAQSE